jgi:hypothetical protein
MFIDIFNYKSILNYPNKLINMKKQVFKYMEEQIVSYLNKQNTKQNLNN